MINTTSSEKINAPTEEKKKYKWGKKEKIVGIVVIFIFIIMFVIASGGDKKTTTETPNSQTFNTVNYQIVERWELPNGGEGKRIIIPAEFQDKENLMLICDKIENDVKNDRNSFVFGFANMTSLQLEKSGSLEDNEGFILNFGKNANTGYHECAVYYGEHTAETEIIKY